MVGTTRIKAQKNEKTKGSREEATQFCWSMSVSGRMVKRGCRGQLGQTMKDLEWYIQDTQLNPASFSDRTNDEVLSWSYLQSRQATALDHRLQTTPQWRKNSLSLNVHLRKTGWDNTSQTFLVSPKTPVRPKQERRCPAFHYGRLWKYHIRSPAYPPEM